MSREKATPFKPLEVPASEIYRFLILQWQHQNQLSWSKLNVMLALETATLGGSFYVRPWWVGSSLLVVGTVVGYILYRLIRRDWHVRDYHLPLLDEVHKGIKFHQCDKEWPIRMIPPAQSWLSNGQNLLRLLFTVMLLTNIAAFAYLPHRFDYVPETAIAAKQSANPPLQRDAPQAARP